MRTEVAKSITEEIDKIFCLLLKANKWQILAARLQKQLQTKTNALQKEAIEAAIVKINEFGDALTEGDIAAIINDLSDSLSVEVVTSLKTTVTQTQLSAFKESYKELDLKFQFNEPNQKALAWLEQDQMYWIKNRYDADLRGLLLEGAKDVIQEGQSLEQQGKAFSDLLKNTYGQNKSYYQGLSNHIVTRSREFARVDGYNEAGIEQVEIVAVMDARTSLICQELNGKIITVSSLAKQRDKLMNAKNPEDVKKIAPFWSDKMTEETFGTAIAKSLILKSYEPLLNKIKKFLKITKADKLPSTIGLPPYHFNCRTRTVPVI